NVALPIGISFYTFHGMSYVFDIYNGKQKPVSNFIDYAVFVSFFPLLVAGPIERASHLLPQIQQKRVFKYSQAVEGCRLILFGMFKKVVIADSISIFVDTMFNDYSNFNAFSLILATIGFSFQIYCDFSGYSDIALGTAKLFGFELLSNFKFPYFSRNVAEFWRRWHISLSSWFRDYLYIPLGGSKNGLLKAIFNTFVIFLVSGFWHGANWNFIIWGGIHACGFLPLLILNKNRTYIHDTVSDNKALPSFIELKQMALTFLFVNFAWIFFRMHNLADAVGLIKKIIFDSITNPSQFLLKPYGLQIFFYITPLIIADWYLRRDERVLKVPNNRVVKIIVYFIFSIVVFTFWGNSSNSFIYFQF
ncbi:MAG: membrane bound O-acyl transferase MBOAT family protein, partial [Chitinophagaceae bacterium]